MDPFFIYTAIIALVVLILILIAFGIMMNKVKSSDAYPPTFNACPDNWKIDSSGNCLFPMNGGNNRGDIAVSGNIISSSVTAPWYTGTGNLLASAGTESNTPSPSSLTLNNASLWGNLTAYKGLPIRCAQKKWADGLGIVWDGITNYNGC
jgi:hypothetical protein